MFASSSSLVDVSFALDAGDLILDDLRDLGFDHVRRCATVFDLDRHDRRVDVRILANREPLEAHHTEDHQHEADDRREDRSLDRDVGQDHRSGSCHGRA